MSLFEPKMDALHQSLTHAVPECKTWRATEGRPWPRSRGKQMILEQDMGAELENGRLPSFATILWTPEPGRVRDGLVSLYGPDIPQLSKSGGEKSVPFGKAVLLETVPIPAEELYLAFEQMDAVRFQQNLNGYMLRGTSQRNREWSRVSREACNNGFRFEVLGGELVRDFKTLPFVRSVEVLFFTEGSQVRALLPLMDECCQIAHALNTMFEKLSMDCKSCDAASICKEIDNLKQLHGRL